MSGAEFAIAVAAVCLGAFVKSVTGLGLPIVAIPVMALFIPLEDAVVIMAIPAVASNVTLAWSTRRAWHGTVDVPVLAVTGALSALVGGALLVVLPEQVLLAALAATVFAYVALTLAHPHFTVSAGSRRWLSPTVGTAAGLLQGATGISGPVYGTYVHALRVEQDAYVLSVTALFAIAGIGQLVVLVASGLFTWTLFAASMLALVPALGFIPLGGRLRSSMSTDRFQGLVLVILTGAAAAIVIRLVA